MPTDKNSLPVILFKVQYRQSKPRQHWRTVDDDIPATVRQFEVQHLRAGLSSIGLCAPFLQCLGGGTVNEYQLSG